jgi:hypothetical protein
MAYDQSGKDWTAFLATFTPDALMTFEGVPAGPYSGLDAAGSGTMQLTVTFDPERA